MDYRYVYLIFTKTNTWLSTLICAFSEIKYPHSSISFDDSFTKMYSFGRKNPANPFSGGFAEENLRKGVYNKSSGCECLIYRVAVTEEQYSSLQNQVDIFVVGKDSLRYNFLGLFGVLFNRTIKRDKHYFCSQFVSEILMGSNVFDFGKTPELITSNDLILIKDKDIVWEGFVNDFISCVS